MDLAKRIRWAREHRGLTQHELAHRLGVAGGSRVSEWENSRRQPSAPILMKLPGILGISGHWLLTGQGPRILEAESASPEVSRDGALEAQLLPRILSGELGIRDAAKQLYEARQAAPAPSPEPSTPARTSDPALATPRASEATQAPEEAPLRPQAAPQAAPAALALPDAPAAAPAPSDESSPAPAPEPGLEPPALPSRMGQRTWLDAPIERSAEPHYAPDPEAVEEEPRDSSIYEGGYLWGHLH